MSLDGRLREGLVRSSTAIEERDLDVLLGSVVRGAKRRRLVRRAVAAAVVLAVGLAAVLFGPRALDVLRDLGRPHPADPSVVQGIITTFAGTGVHESFGDGGPAADAGFNYPVDVAIDDSGNVFILDHAGQRVRKVDPTGTITTVVGIPAGGSASVASEGEAGSLELIDTTGIDVDSAGNLYLSPASTTVVKISPPGNVTTVAGSGTRGYSGDGGPATEAAMAHIWDVAVDATGSVYIAAGNVVRKVDSEGIITTIAGTGKNGFSGDGGPAVDARLGRVTGVAVDAIGNVYLIDYQHDRVRRVDPAGIITTVAGPGKGDACIGPAPFADEGAPAAELDLCDAEHLSIDAVGNIFVADTLNHRIVMIDTKGVVTTVAGTGTPAYVGDGDRATSAELWEPSGVTVGRDGFLYIADSGNGVVRRLAL